jgi:hypothetical protein
VSAAAASVPAPRWTLRRLWLLALPLAAGWFGFWGLLWQPELFSAPRELPRFAAHARYLPARAPAEGGEAARDLRVMWSPVLFALPTPMGFSRAPAAGDGHDRPRVQRPDIEPRLMPPPPAAALTPVVPAPRQPALNDGANFRVDGVAPVFAQLPAITSTLTSEVLGDLAAVACLEKPLPPLPQDLTVLNWQVVAKLEVGREGRVQHVFLDPPSTSAGFNAQLTQALLRWRFAPAAAAAQGQVRLQHLAAPQPPAAKPEGVAP